jgi:DNA-directed RNA polymerase
MSWITPLGLPVMQPYRREYNYTIQTVLQSVTLSMTDDVLPVSVTKQRSAFPPNFIHSLDATHMLLTSLKMKEKNLTFAAVHDSYWTHASNVVDMKKVNMNSSTLI